MFKFYLQIFAGFQHGFLVSRGRCPLCKRFRPKSYESCPRFWSQTLLLPVTMVLPNLQEELNKNLMFNVYPKIKVQGFLIRP